MVCDSYPAPIGGVRVLFTGTRTHSRASVSVGSGIAFIVSGMAPVTMPAVSAVHEDMHQRACGQQ
jgi:hypothetical protein